MGEFFAHAQMQHKHARMGTQPGESLACSLPSLYQLHWSNNAAFRMGTTTCHRRSHATETHARRQQEHDAHDTKTFHLSSSTHHSLCARWKIQTSVVFRIQIFLYIISQQEEEKRGRKKKGTKKAKCATRKLWQTRRIHTHTPSPRPRSSRSRALRFFGFLRV
jgi:hypothetical protein